MPYRPILRCVTCCSILGAAFLGAVPGISAADRPVSFNRDIRPIMSDTCFHCHGPDKNARKAGLRLDLRDEALKPAESGAIPIVPGNPDESEIVQLILEDVMPPPAAHKKLTNEQKETFRRWVAEGAKYEPHWSYTPLAKAAIPAGENGIDFLVARRLADIKLQPSPEADRRTLARRLSFDLVGLPPHPAEAEAFVNDKSAGAYSKLVEKLLASPHYGERMAIGWLDVVRFADTIGYHSDNPRNVWPYRDYVIKAFNENKPFDQFTREQLAGDLLPEPTQETRVASAFNRLLLTTEEGGAQAKDYEQRYLTDRVRAIGTVWLGQTLGCCQCHDHKFDPASQRDFYSMGAFFADIKEPIIGRPEDGMLVLTDEQRRELAAIDSRLAALKAELDRPHPELAEPQQAWEIAALAAVRDEARWTTLKPTKASSAKGNVNLEVSKSGLVQSKINAKRNVREQNDGTEVYRITIDSLPAGVTGFRVQAVKDKTEPIGHAANGNFVLSEIRIIAGDKNKLPLAGASATFEQPGFPAEAAIDGVADTSGNGWAVLGATGVDQSLYLQLADSWQPSSGDEPVTFELRFVFGGNHEIRNVRLSAATSAEPVRAPAAAMPPVDIADLLAIESSNRTAEQKAALERHFKQVASELQDLREKLAEVERQKKTFELAAPKCIVSMQNDKRRTVRILPRGNWMDESGEAVQAALPAFLPQPKRESAAALTRLDLAEWIVSRDNPLTARVFVNRLWKQFFGSGLSRVLDDLGAQGEPPHHPELLDWLAAEFRDSGWDVKHLVRTIVNSRTYRQTSTASADLAARDSGNRELACQSRWRLDAELVRDNALAIAGLLVRDIGGPSVKPYQPDGYWENLNFPPRNYEPSQGNQQYRRGLYTWWQRSFVHPSMLAFDAPTREECAADRSRSNVPQQALVLLNDPSYVEAARAFATRIMRESDPSVDARIAWAWREALARMPSQNEVEIMRTLFDKHRAEFAGDEQAAESLLNVGLTPAPADLDAADLAAWTNVARVILNLHETITRN